jgi:hypothetical protein
LVDAEEVGFVQDDDDSSAAFVFFGGEQLADLRDQAGLVEPGVAPRAVTIPA